MRPFRLRDASLPQAEAPIPAGYWVWTWAPAYKNDILVRYQKALKRRGIVSQADLKLFVQQAIQENGALNHLATHGDFGCSVGLPQLYVCSAAKPAYRAKHFLADNPQWQSITFQIEYLAEQSATAYQRYNGNIKWAVISHNCPECAQHHTDRFMCNLGAKGLRALNGVDYTTPRCLKDGGKVQGYYRDEVAQQAKLLSLSQ